ncbi:Cell division control protein 25 [Psilocybe cubensis]|uniref:Ras GEF n=2 Tax=Psilocybe cubensis TaxID=181762 RepID=A0A8H7XSR1_PSICU|nr:Cell division control protein 25 [Psilocybe cubensis]KAH9480569.1 Cell division control protein 25 [Psilocybe cubensis]
MATVAPTRMSPSANTIVESVTQNPNGHLQFDNAQPDIMFCRAKYDYTADVPSALSFQTGDIIEVLTQLPSGWWDGLLNGERGWFPSNYTEVMTDEEVERVFSGALEPVIQDVPTIVFPPSQSSTLSDGRLNAPHQDMDNSTSSHQSDFWIPEVTPDGRQIFYVNIKTGQRSRDLPRESDNETSDDSFSALKPQKATRSGNSEDLGLGTYNNAMSTGGMEQTSDDSKAANALTSSPPRSSQTTDGKVSSADSDTSRSDHLFPPRERPAVVSDPDIPQFLPQVQANSMSKISIAQLTSDERNARILEQALEPQSPSPNIITDLAFAVRIAIQNVVGNVKSSGLSRKPVDDKKMDKLICSVVLAVQNLLYLAAASPIHFVADLPHPRGFSVTQPSTAALKSPQRKVTAILSRLVLSARALVYNSGSPLSETLTRIESDAEELQRDVNSFVFEAQRIHGQTLGANKNIKRIQGYFAANNTGLGLVGAGSAASWKGFGYHFRDVRNGVPQKVLDADVILEIDLSVDRLQRRIISLQEAILDRVSSAVQELVTYTSTFLTFIADVYVARHVDIDGVRQSSDASLNNEYTRMVNDARLLVRSMEAVVQAIYDDSASLLLTTQNLHEGVRNAFSSEREDSYETLKGLTISLANNLSHVKRIFGNLLSLGYEQAEAVKGDYKESIDWRFSGISAIKIHLGTEDGHTSYNEELVDIELALQQSNQRNSLYPELYPPSPPGGSSPEDSPPDMPSNSNKAPQSNFSPKGFEDDDDTESIAPSVKPPPRPSGSTNVPKLEQILGIEYADKVAAGRRPWYLRADYKDSDIIIDADNSVRGGTLPALVERLTAHDQADTTFTQAFLVTYKSFTTLDELFDLLVARFHLQQPEGLSPAEREEWTKLKQHVVRTRVINTMKTMVDGMLDPEDMYILDKMKGFVSSDEVSTYAAAKNLLVQIERTKAMGDAKTLINTNQEPPPPPIIPKSAKQPKLLDIDPLELARQFTIIESESYQKIKPIEGLQRARMQKNEHDDDIAAVIQMSNRIAEWIVDCILSKEDPRRRAQVVKYLISVADRCRLLKNFSTMGAIISGLNTPPIRRLKKTWDQISQRYMAQFTACEVTVDSFKNFGRYRTLMASVTPPYVPFLGVSLSTLQFIQDGNPDKLSGDMINFRKFQKASEVIIDIRRWQTQSFNLQPLPSVISYIKESLSKFSGGSRSLSDHFWELSLIREPREKDDSEKFARLLQESGF